MAATRQMAARKLRAVLSYRVAIPRKSLMRQKVRSMTLRSLSRSVSCGMASLRGDVLGMTAAVPRSARKRRRWLASQPLSPTSSPSGATAETRVAAAVMSATLPPVSRIACGRPCSSQSAWILVCARGASGRSPGGRHRLHPLVRAGSRAMRLHRGTVDHRDPGRVSAGRRGQRRCAARARAGSSGSSG